MESIEFELRLNIKSGEPEIRFTMDWNENSLHKEVLERFITQAQERGLWLGSYHGILSDNENKDYFIIKLNEEESK